MGRMVASRCPECGRTKKRSHQANARYWLLLHVISEKILPGNSKGFSAETWHTYFKQRYLGCEEFKLPNGETLNIPHSTADLSTSEFADYVLKVELWAGERNVYLDEMGD